MGTVDKRKFESGIDQAREERSLEKNDLIHPYGREVGKYYNKYKFNLYI